MAPPAGALACAGARVCASPRTSTTSLLPGWQITDCLELHPSGPAVRIRCGQLQGSCTSRHKGEVSSQKHLVTIYVNLAYSGPGPESMCLLLIEEQLVTAQRNAITHVGSPHASACAHLSLAIRQPTMCRCGLVGVTNVLCGGLVMEAIAYQALVEGTCRPVCDSGPPEPCLSGQHRPLTSLLSRGMRKVHSWADASHHASMTIGPAKASRTVPGLIGPGITPGSLAWQPRHIALLTEHPPCLRMSHWKVLTVQLHLQQALRRLLWRRPSALKGCQAPGAVDLGMEASYLMRPPIRYVNLSLPPAPSPYHWLDTGAPRSSRCLSAASAKYHSTPA